MLRDYRDWLEAEVRRLDAASERPDALEFARLARDRFESETSDTLCVEVGRPLARRVLTSLEMLGQRDTALRPEFDELRDAIKTAYDLAVYPPDQDREPLEREVL